MVDVAVIAGSGPSLRATDRRRIPAGARIARVNNFFLETEYHLGRHVDCVYFSADKRALRFYVATLKQVVEAGDYDIKTTASAHPRAAGLQPPATFRVLQVADDEIRSLIADEQRSRNILPTSGVMAAVGEVELGAHTVILTGLDLYGEGPRYAYSPPRQLSRILAPNAQESGHDTGFHASELDERILMLLMDRGVEFRTAHTAPRSIGETTLEPAPVLPPGAHLAEPPAKAPHVTDWVRRSGLASIDALVAARWLRRQVSRRRGFSEAP